MHNRYTKREIMAGYCFILPAAVFLALIVIYPLIYNLSMSFHEVTLETFRGEQPFIGLENYREVLAMPMVRKAMVMPSALWVISHTPDSMKWPMK